MQIRSLLYLMAMLSAGSLAKAQPFFIDCTCLSTQSVLITNACQAVVPDLCQFTNCYGSTIVPPIPLTCSQLPPAGTPVGPGTYVITVSVLDPNGTAQSCAVPFTVNAPPGGCNFTLLCASNKTVECDAPWTFDPPTWTNNCAPPLGTPSNGVMVAVLSTTTNGFCPTVITRTWQAVDDCMHVAMCSQTVTVVDTKPPALDCRCLTNTAGLPPIPLTVTNCTGVIPDLCPYALLCASDNCGPLTCTQSPPAGTVVFPGTHPITVTVLDCASNAVSCVLNFVVVAPTPPGPFALICAPSKTVECGTPWSFDPPAATNFCCPPLGTVGNGVTVTVLSTTTNGSCPVVITRTWQGVDGCGQTAACSQTVTVADTTPPVLDCNCLRSNPAIPLTVIACSNAVPDLCQLLTTCATDNCGPITCSQSPPAGTIVYPGAHPITVTVTDCATNTASCVMLFTVVPPAPPGPFALICAPNKTVECGNTWSFDPPVATNFCCTAPGTPGNGVTITVVSTTTNGTCPEVITRTWQGVDSCSHTAVCSQVVTIVDTTPPVLNCQCLSNNPAIPLTVIACSNTIPNLCLGLSACATDACGPITCSQSPPAGTLVFPGVHAITVTVTDCATNSATCTIQFTVIAPPGGCIPCTYTTNAWNTGMSGGNPLPPGMPDPNYVLVSAPPGGCTGPAQVLNPVTLPVPPWVANGPNSQWIGGGPGANCEPGVYHYRLCFYVPCTDGASIIGQWAADDNGAIHLNGQPTGHTIPSPQFPNLPAYGWFPVAITNGFVCGTNCLDFYITNANLGINPTGFRAELTNFFNDCCCPPVQRIGSVFSGAGAGGLLPPQAPDNQFAFTCVPPGVTATVPVVIDPLWIPGVWLPNSTTSQWIGPDPFNNAPAGVYCYTMNFTVPCPPGVPLKASLTGRWTADDWASLELNGLPTGHTVPSVQFPSNGFDVWHPINITNGFVSGLNSVTFYVTNAGGPTGLRLELDINASCCDCTNILCVVSIACPPGVTNLTCGTSTNVNYPTPSASSNCGAITNVACVPPSGSPFPLGNTPVTCTARDAQGNSGSCTFTVTVATDPSCCVITPVFTLNSGANSSGLLPGGVFDPQFLTGPPLFTTPSPWVMSSIHPIWVPNSAVSKWVGPRQWLSAASGGVYVYTNRFFLCSTNQASITGRWTADDSGSIRLNGAATGHFLPPGWAFTNWHAVNITSGFVPGWNTLTFHVTNYSTSVSGLRTELRATACCNQCVSIACPANVTRTNCPPGGSVTYPAPTATSACGNIVSLACSPPSGAFFPLGTNTVACTAIDAGGNAATCSFNVIVRPAAGPVTVMCPPNQTLLVCANSAVAYYKVKAMGQTGPVVCTPPSGTTFPLGTNVVTCTATNFCGQSASCTFLVIVKNHLTGPPALTLTAGLPDNFVQPPEPSPPSACMITAFGGFPLWKAFDSNAANVVFGHRFAGLPNNIAKAELVVRMRPTSDGGAANDGIHIGLPTCGAARYIATISTLPGAGGNWNPGHPATTFTFNLGVLNPLLISDMNTQGYLDAVVHDDTTVDYMQLRIWRCPPPSPGIGVPFEVVGGATIAQRPGPVPGPIIGIPLPAICVFPNPNNPSGVHLQPGAARTLSFTTVIDFDAPVDAGLDLVLPPDPRNTNGMPFLSFRNKGSKGYCLKTAKLYDDEPDISYRSSAIGTNGDLFSSFTWDAANIETNVLLWLNRLPGVTSVVMTVTFDLETREATLEFPHCIWTPDFRRKGWDGCIYGNGTPSKGTKTNKTARLILTPTPPHTPLPPVFDLSLLATGLAEFLVEDPEIETMGRKWSDGHVTLMKAYDDGETERLSYITVGEGGGVHTDLGNAGAFTVSFHHFENGDIPDEEQVFRVIGGPIRGLTNRPPPPTIPLRLAEGPGGVHCTIDFSDLAAESITVQLWRNGVLVGEGTGPGAAITAEAPLIIDRWPHRFGRPALNESWLSLSSVEPMIISGIMGDELRFIPGLPSGVEFPVTFTGLELLASDGTDGLLYGLQRTLVCPPAPLTIQRGTDSVQISWTDEGYRLQGAETVTGPWYDLGADSPVVLDAAHTARFFRLICD